jgi:hypothetical protein
MSDVYCSQASLHAGERLAGTAISRVDRFVVIEHATAWGPKGVADSGLPANVVSYLEQLGERYPRLRVQLARKSEGAALGELRVFFAETGEGPGRLSALKLPALSELLTLELDAWLRGESAAPGVQEQEPLYLVCVHGKRDRCCALYGLPVYRALASQAGERTLQTTHLGGHRFAATLLVLPVGLCYGRVQPSEAAALHEAARRGELYDVARLRGRTSYASEVQAAEIALRERLDERRAHALALTDCSEPTKGTFRVCFEERDSGAAHTVELLSEPRAPAPASCGAAPKPGQQLVPLRLTAAG